MSWWIAIWKWKLPAFVPGGLAVQLAALDEHDLDPLAREVVGERGAGEAAADDEHVGLGGSGARGRSASASAATATLSRRE